MSIYLFEKDLKKILLDATCSQDMGITHLKPIYLNKC